jgi:hypothetical protein
VRGSPIDNYIAIDAAVSKPMREALGQQLAATESSA